jgi:APA family basic amino acid/polyamine antiporter
LFSPAGGRQSLLQNNTATSTESRPSAMKILRRKTVAALQAEAESDQRLHRALGPVNLIALGIGAIIGTGIFVLTGTVAAQNAGPAVVLSFVLAGIASVFAALCYSEFASLVPLSGSAYTYGYATLGEFFAWVIGWDLILEYAVGAITVAIGWSGYVVSFLRGVGVYVPPELSAARGTHLIEIPAQLAAALRVPAGWQALSDELSRQIAAQGATLSSLPHATAIFNLPAVIIIFIVTTLLVVGVKEAANFNNGIVFVKLAVIGLFLFGAAHAISAANWHPFIPENAGVSGHFGWSGVLRGAGIVFFAYIGFDAVSTAAQEAKNPKRDMPIGIIGSLVVCTVLYILVSAVATGVVPYRQLDVPDPIALAADHAGLGWMASLIKLGAIAGLSSVILVMLYGQSRVFWAMSRDGLLPPFVHHVHPRFRTPWITSVITGVLVALFAAVFTVREAGSLCSIGTLLAFVIVSVGILALRLRHPELRPAFRAPLVWFVAPAGAGSALTLMFSLPWLTWERLIVWFAIGMVIYFSYGVHNSRLGLEKSPVRRNDPSR